MPVNRDPLNAKTMRALQNGWIAGIGIRCADRHLRSARFDLVAVLASVRRTDGHTHALTQTVRGSWERMSITSISKFGFNAL